MFRAIIKDRKNLNGQQIADVPILSGSVSEDKTQKASSRFTVSDLPDSVKVGDVIGVYDSTGKFYYWGVITSKGDNPDPKSELKIQIRELSCDQFESLYDDSHLLATQTTTNQKSFFNNYTVSEVIDMYLQSKELGFVSTANTMNATGAPTFSSFIDLDVKNTFKGIRHYVIDAGEDHLPFPTEKETQNLADFLYDTFIKYHRIIRPFVRTVVLPDEYKQINYIESDGTGQYLNTGISPSMYLNKLRIELDASFTSLSYSDTYVTLLSSGYYSETGDNRRNVAIGKNATDFLMLSGAQISTGISVGTADTERHLFILDQAKKYYGLNNNTSFSTTVNSNLSEPIILLAYYNTASAGQPIERFAKGRIYGCKIYNEGKIIRNYIPCYRKSDSVAGLYDTINNKFIVNDGSGTLIKSNEIFDKDINVAIFKPEGTIQYDEQHSWNYNKKVLFDTWESIANVQITDEDVSTNTLVIFNDEGSSVRAAFTVLEDGTIQQMTTGESVADRYGTGKTEYVFDSSNNLSNLAQSSLPPEQFNHKITFTIAFNGEYSFDDFNLGQPIDFYSKNKPGKAYVSSLTGWSYEINQNSEKIINAEFTLGNVRNNLTSKINLITKKKKK